MELLAHISAPTSKQADDRYVAQAQAYLNFEAVAESKLTASGSIVVLTASPAEANPKHANRLEHSIAQNEERVLDSPISQITPTMSALRRLEAIQSRWKQSNRPQARKRCFDMVCSEGSVTATSVQSTSNNLKGAVYVDTQLAVAAVQSQVELSLSDDCNKQRGPCAVSSPKRQKLSQQAEPELECPPSSSTASNQHDGSSRSHLPLQLPSTPQPEISSLLPASYGFSRSSQSRTPSSQQAQAPAKGLRVPSSNGYHSSPSAGSSTVTQIISAPFPVDEQVIHLVGSQERVELQSSPLTGLWVKERTGLVGKLRSCETKDELQSGTTTIKSLVKPGKDAQKAICVPFPVDEDKGTPKFTDQFGPGVTASSPTKELEKHSTRFSNIKPSAAANADTSVEISSAAKERPGVLRQLRDLPTTVSPAPPEVDSLDWSDRPTHVTAALSSLNHHKTSKLFSAYQPEYQPRELDAWERGYWVFDASEWDPGTQLSFWEYMVDFVGSGRAGYATRLERGCDAGGIGSPDVLGTVRIWCFGDEVMHIYLLLYAASLARIKKSRAEWRSWNYEVMIRMPYAGRRAPALDA